MHTKSVVTCAKVLRRTERIRQDEHAQLRPPQRHLLPEASRSDRNELELRDARTGHDVMRNAEPRRELRAIAVVTIEQLDDARRSSGTNDSIVQPVTVERVDQPDSAVGDERMRAALHEFVGDPAKAVLELVAVADPHCGESTGTP